MSRGRWRCWKLGTNDGRNKGTLFPSPAIISSTPESKPQFSFTDFITVLQIATNTGGRMGNVLVGESIRKKKKQSAALEANRVIVE